MLKSLKIQLKNIYIVTNLDSGREIECRTESEMQFKLTRMVEAGERVTFYKTSLVPRRLN